LFSETPTLWPQEYGHLYSADFKPPIPAKVMEIINGQHGHLGNAFGAWYTEQVRNGTLPELPPPVPAAPATSDLGRAYQQGQASESTGEAAWRGFKEAAGPAFVRGVLSLFKR
jgi:hypothetical protein